MLPNRSRKIVEEYEKSLKRPMDENLKSQIGEEETFLTLMKRMVRENKLAVFSAVVILLFIIAAVLAPVISPYGLSEMDLRNRLSPPGAGHL